MVVVLCVLAEHSLEMARVQYQQSVQAFLSRRPDPTLGDGVGVWTPVRRQDDVDTLGLEHRIEALAELGIPVVDEEANRQ